MKTTSKIYFFSFLVFYLFLLSGCQKYLNQGAVGGGFGEDDFCVVNPYDERCQYQWGPQVLGDGSGEDFLKRANYEFDRQTAEAYNALREQGDDGKLTRDDIREINVLIGLPSDATAEDRRAWYAEFYSTLPTISKQPFSIQPGYTDTGEITGTDPASVADSLKKQDAIKVFEKIINLPDNPKAVNPAQNNALKQRAAQVTIQALAALVTGKDINQGAKINADDIRAALRAMNDVSGTVADKHFGNNDGKVDFEEIQKLNNAVESNPGLKAYMNMVLQYNP